MKYLLISLLVLGTTSCAFKKVNKTSDDVVSSSSDSGDKLDE
ncbi:putative lipoprotein, partial [Bacteriovorax sp. DB6_IX]